VQLAFGRGASQSDRLLEIYGGPGRGGISLTSAASVSEVGRGPARAVGGMLVRGLVYVLIGLAAFVVVTFLAARG
jgi:hypothetical protein